MILKRISNLIRSYLLTLAGGACSPFVLFLMFSDAIVYNDEGPMVFFILGTLMTFFIPAGIGVFIWVPITLIEENRMLNSDFTDLAKRYVPFPALVISFFVTILFFTDEDTNTRLLMLALITQAYCIVMIQLISYLRELKNR